MSTAPANVDKQTLWRRLQSRTAALKSARGSTMSELAIEGGMAVGLGYISTRPEAANLPADIRLIAGGAGLALTFLSKRPPRLAVSIARAGFLPYLYEKGASGTI